MKFAEFARYLQKLESTPSRLEITKTLAELLEGLNPSEVAEGVFLSLGTLGPGYERIEFGISEKLMVKIIARAFLSAGEEVTKLFKSAGDLGSVAQELSSKLDPPAGGRNSKLTVGEVYVKLKEMAEAEGPGSAERKVSLGAKILQSLDSLSVRFAVRVPLGTMRLGFSEKTVLEALALLDSGEKEVSFAKGSESRAIKGRLESKFNVFPNIGEIAKAFRAKGPKGLSEVRMRVGVPILPQLCARLTTAEEMIEKVGVPSGEVAAEYKYDGVRLQVHLDREMKKIRSARWADETRNLPLDGFGGGDDQGVTMYTRNLEQMQEMFPDLTREILKFVSAKEVILDGEAVGVDPKTGKFIPFQETMQRKRKYDIEEMAKKIPVKYFAFDILYKDGEDLTALPYTRRRKVLLETIGKNEKIKVTSNLVTGDAQKLTDFFKEAKDKGLEGLVVKNIDGSYEAGSRGFSWVKFKREETGELSDTLDCVVLGYYKGTGKRTGFGIGAFLVGVFDEKLKKFVTVAKIGTGLTDEEWKTFKTQISKFKTQKSLGNVEIRKELMPDVLCRPEIVVQIRADEITISPIHASGFALRFPRMMSYRTDKNSPQATTLAELRELYKMQEKK